MFRSLLHQYLRCDRLLADIEVGAGVAGVLTLTNTVDLVVDRGSVVVSHLTSTGNSPLHVRWMPCTDTSDLSKTLVCLTRKLLGAPSAGDTLKAVTLGDSNAVDHLVLLENAVDVDWLLEETVCELDLVCDRATVDLDLHKVCLLLLERCLADLGVGENTDDSAVLLDSLKLTSDVLAALLSVLLGISGESLLLALVPVLVESSLELIAEMLSPHRGQRAQAAWCLDVSNQANNNHLECTDQRMPSMVLAPYLVPEESR